MNYEILFSNVLNPKEKRLDWVVHISKETFKTVCP